MEFEFSLRFELEECDGLLDVAMERLDATGSTSTLLGASINAVLELQFVRRAVSAQEALTEATATVEKAFPGARLVSISPAPDTPAA
ncbi:hypothetical protein SAMN05428960_1038 [Mitsuaria sp. PDC51]|nr:hypothetical protein SAMN05428960_1038 [Mitsuaria sp. PDC51]